MNEFFEEQSNPRSVPVPGDNPILARKDDVLGRSTVAAEVRSQSAGSRAVRRFPRLVWDPLVELYGDEAVLKQRFEALKATNPENDDELLGLAEKYLSGWRPKDFQDE